MSYAQSFETALSDAELDVLAFLDRKWPIAATVTPFLIRDNSPQASGQTGFVETIQGLSDNGLILYEAFLIEASTGKRFVDAMITARGKAALRQYSIDAEI